ncbi:T7SS effector LXG polymorphic toxin [Pseudogracilibacillus auburnensis]|uniref:WXG superfamily protein probably secreted by type VII secretion system n=2 Tax=Pseudogracilibacillus auburnensis TaxID=1494959 RepID=A0A2V3VXN9_9BACI|nr:T7SS effector LXG polymorphic toxin [Pseudogracilibacillus auburnensis]PXW86350.1 WXG superfamily protein probably secreted by type VII secretion system [Pseudogracilibacillus auburnensis]
MSIRMILPEVNKQTSSVEQMCYSYISSMELIKESINAFIIETGLKGKTYDSAKAYFAKTYIPLADGIILLSEAMIESHRQFL